MSTAETFEAWATGAAATATAVAIAIGGGWALWRYVLPGPFGPAWEMAVGECSARRLGSGRYLYIVDVGVTNSSNTLCTVERAALAIILPDKVPMKDDEPTDDARKKELDREEIEVKVRCPPQHRTTLHTFRVVDDTLSQAVFVAWRIVYRRPQWLGVFGSCKETMEAERYVPVDPRSLALYRKQDQEACDN